MGYAGGFCSDAIHPTEAQEIGAFLQAALRQVTPEHPYRGPKRFRQGVYSYLNEVEGNVYRFSGTETIARKDRVVYQLRYSGGALR